MQNIFGTVNAPVNIANNDPTAAVGSILGFIIQIVFLVAGLATLLYLLMGAFDWITSEGQKEKLEKAQKKIMNAVIGLLLIVVAFTLFSFFMGTVLGGKFGIGGDLSITIPRIGN